MCKTVKLYLYQFWNAFFRSSYFWRKHILSTSASITRHKQKTPHSVSGKVNLFQTFTMQLIIWFVDLERKSDPAASLWHNFHSIFKCRTVSDFPLASLLNDQVPSPSFIVVINGISASSFFWRQPSVSSSSWLFQQNNWSFQVRQAL